MTTPGGDVLAVVGGLMTAFGTIPDLTVLDYALAGRDVTGNAVIVGEQVAVEKLPASRAGAMYDAQVTVAFRVLCASGSRLPGPTVQSAAGVLDAAQAAVEADPTLGGACDHAVLSPSSDWSSSSDQEGAMTEIAGTVVARRPAS